MTLHKILIPVLLILPVLFCGTAAEAATTESGGREYKLKAAFFLNFSKFTTWPKEAFSESGQIIDFCVVGEDPFGTALDGLESKKVGGRKVRLHYAGSIAAVKTCHVMFISKSEKNHLAQLRQNTDGRPILTVSDIEGFSRQGGVFEFITKDGRLSFIVDNQQATRNGLQISASLLNLAAEVL